jgi:MoaA/NifB/PqqE/SkfB family radical SAM enzyme
MKTWADAYENKTLSLVVEATTYCNAKCPQCQRTNRNGLGKADFVDLNSWSLDDFISYFNVEDLKHIRNIHFSGTHGDPGMCKDIAEIINYIFKSSEQTTVSMNSNGSTRDEDWWYELSKNSGKRLGLTFDVDGINQEMHEKYRRGTNLQKVLDNMHAAALGGARIKTFTVLFRHNEEYYPDIVNLVKQYGCDNSFYVQSNRFKQGPSWEFVNENGENEVLEQAVLPEYQPDPHALSRRVRDHRTVHLVDDYDYIKCVKAEAGSLQILNDTQVFPCCYLGTYKQTEPYGIWKTFLDGNFKLKNKSLKEIVYSDWYEYLIFESLKSPSTALSKCKRICSMKNDDIIAVSV